MSLKKLKNTKKESINRLKNSNKKILTEQLATGDMLSSTGITEYGLSASNPCDFVVEQPDGDLVLLSGYFSTNTVQAISLLCNGYNG